VHILHITIELRARVNAPAGSATYKKYIRKFKEGTAQEWTWENFGEMSVVPPWVDEDHKLTVLDNTRTARLDI
jgi:hypothetical protein